MRLIATCQLTGDYGTVSAGQDFIVPDAFAEKLIAQGCARRADPPRVLYESKPARFEMPAVKPEAPEVSARPPFRNGALLDEKSATLPAASDPVLPKSNVSESGTADSGRRGRREGSGPGR